VFHRSRHFLAITCLTITLVAFAAIVGLSPNSSVLAAPLPQTDPAVIVGAGDISNCSNTEDMYTAYLMDSIEGTVITLGDDAYEAGTLAEFNECYDPTWGRHKERTRPVPGNHEYGTQGAEGYFTYYGEAATPLEPECTRDCKGYYSYDVGAWHVVALNSEIPNQAGSEQEQWLRADLAANPTACTLAYYHRPTFSSGHHGSGAAIDLYQALYDYGADVVLVGHDHNYERFAPQSPSGEYEPERGIRQIVVGTGGATLRDFEFIQPNSEVRDHETWGVIKMTLYPDSYDWEFIPMPGQTFTDAGSSPCVSNPDLPPPPEPSATEVEAESAADSIIEIATTGVAATPVTTVTSGATTGSTAASASTSSTATGSQYILQPGDTLFAVALRYGVDWTDLAEANGLTENSLLQIGQILAVPGTGSESSPVSTTTTNTSGSATTTPVATTRTQTATTGTSTAGSSTTTSRSQASGDTVTVTSGDTIISIALANDVDWQELLEVNGLEEDSIIQIGQELELP